MGQARASGSAILCRPSDSAAASNGGCCRMLSGAGKLVGDVTEPPTASRAGGCVDGDCPGDERV